MGRKGFEIYRREFVRHGVGMGAGALALGRSPQQACEDACDLIVRKYQKVNPNFIPGEKFVAINKDGEYGAAAMGLNRARPQMTVRSGEGLRIHEGTVHYTG